MLTDTAELQLPAFAKHTEDGRIALYLDNHLLQDFNSCEARFHLKHVKNLRLKGDSLGGALKIGIWWSSVLENYYSWIQQFQRGEPVGYTLEDKFIPLAFTLPCRRWIELACAKAWVDEGMDTWGAASERTQKAMHKFKGPEGALLMCHQYYDQYAEMDSRNWKIIAAELGFGLSGEVLVYENDKMLCYWTGRPDLIVYDSTLDSLMAVDHKSKDYMKSNFIQQWKPHPQTAGYVYALQVLSKSLGYDRTVDRCIINGAARLYAEKPRDGKAKPRFMRVLPHYSAGELAEWRYMTSLKAIRLYNAILADTWVWDETSCHIYAGCEYRRIHTIPEGSRALVERADYVQIEPWAPYVNIEEEEEVEA